MALSFWKSKDIPIKKPHLSNQTKSLGDNFNSFFCGSENRFFKPYFNESFLWQRGSACFVNNSTQVEVRPLNFNNDHKTEIRLSGLSWILLDRFASINYPRQKVMSVLEKTEFWNAYRIKKEIFMDENQRKLRKDFIIHRWISTFDFLPPKRL